MKKGDFVLVDYVGTVSETGEVFDSTKREIAEEKGIFNPNLDYGPVPIIIDAGLAVKGLEDGLKKMKIGERKKIKVSPEKAFGKRSPKLIRLIPISKFREQKISPYPGMPIKIKNFQGRVISVSGGRVKVDFNHPLAGKTLEYDLEVKKKITTKKSKVRAVLEIFLGTKSRNMNVEMNEDEVEIKISEKENVAKGVKKIIADTIRKWIKGIKKVRFIDEY